MLTNNIKEKLPFLSYKQQLYSRKRNLFRKVKSDYQPSVQYNEMQEQINIQFDISKKEKNIAGMYLHRNTKKKRQRSPQDSSHREGTELITSKNYKKTKNANTYMKIYRNKTPNKRRTAKYTPEKERGKSKGVVHDKPFEVMERNYVRPENREYSPLKGIVNYKMVGGGGWEIHSPRTEKKKKREKRFPHYSAKQPTPRRRNKSRNVSPFSHKKGKTTTLRSSQRKKMRTPKRQRAPPTVELSSEKKRDQQRSINHGHAPVSPSRSKMSRRSRNQDSVVIDHSNRHPSRAHSRVSNASSTINKSDQQVDQILEFYK